MGSAKTLFLSCEQQLCLNDLIVADRFDLTARTLAGAFNITGECILCARGDRPRLALPVRLRETLDSISQKTPREDTAIGLISETAPLSQLLSRSPPLYVGDIHRNEPRRGVMANIP